MLEAKSVHLCIGVPPDWNFCRAGRPPVSLVIYHRESARDLPPSGFLPKFAEKNLGHIFCRVLHKAVFLWICRYHIFYLLKAALNVIGKEALQPCQFTVGFALPIPAKIHERLWEVRVAPETWDSQRQSEQTRQPACPQNAKNSPRPFWDRIILEKTWNELVSASDLVIIFLLRFYFIDCLVYCCRTSDLDCVDFDNQKTSGTVSQQIDAGFWQVQFSETLSVSISIFCETQQLIRFDCLTYVSNSDCKMGLRKQDAWNGSRRGI